MASSTGNEYTTVADVKLLLQDSSKLPVRLSDANIGQMIRDASRRIDSVVNRRFPVPFPDVTDDPDTPEDIQTLCKVLAAEWSMRIAKMLDNTTIDEQGRGPWERQTMASLDRLADGTDQLGDSGTPAQKAYFIQPD